ncbi:DNA polymerase I [uncultured Helcococcus sp.]|uniref:DNA polymerase I n=1 Tax=uncultured Helcococcus sp. TaxID=1072508 RepID=UPI0028892C6A|nr:DNA polymerase I [uncultured Helcococcus sp.]
MEKILLIDGSSLIFRAFYAIRNLSTKDGLPTGAVYGFVNMLNAAIKQIEPNYIAVAFDKAGPTFRTREYADYKGTRDKTPDELNSQFGIVRDLLDSYGIKHFSLDDYEADDIIASLSKQANAENIESYMLTGDRDYFQLIDDHAYVLYTVKGISKLEIYDKEKIKEKYDGLDPKDLIEIKGLMGDSSDNIPGVPGVGEKTAIKLIKEYSTIENIYENIDKIKGKALPKNLLENENLAYLSRKLGKIICDLDLGIEIEDLKVQDENRQELYEKYKALEFTGLMKEYSPEVEEAHDFNASLLDKKDYKEVVDFIEKEKELVFDLINEDDYTKEKPRFLAIKSKDNRVYTLDLVNDFELFEKHFKALFESDKIEKVSFDIKKSIVMLDKLGVQFSDNYLDLMILSYLINPSGSYSLQDIGLSFLNVEIKALDEYLGKGKNKKSVGDLDHDQLLEYQANNLFVISKAKKLLLDKIEEMEMTDLLYEVDLPLVKVLAEMEIYGVESHAKEFEKLDKEISSKIDDLENEIYDQAGEEFNINSPKQLGVILFEKLELPVIKKTKTGYSTNIDVLKKLEDKHPIIPMIEEYRQLAKLKSTYIDGLIPMIGEDNRIHSKFNQTVAATGRLSSTEPNLQNIPIKTEEGRLIRKGFFAGKDKKLVSADYSQIELRVLAALTNDKNMLSAFEQGIDIHTKTAAEVFKVDLDEVTKLQRSEAKAVNFGIVYGISDYGISEDLNITRKQARNYIDSYLDSYPQIHKYMDDIVEIAKEQGYVKTMFARRRYIPELSSSNFNLRSFGERIALNSPIQGTAADIIKIAMINVYNRLKKDELKAKLILQIHDELIIESPDDELEKVKKIIKEEMENAVDIGVKLLVDVEVGDSWYEV